MSIRENDRDYQVGDACKFYEWIPGDTDEKGYATGNASGIYRIRYILKRSAGLVDGFVVLLLDGPWGQRKNIY